MTLFILFLIVLQAAICLALLMEISRIRSQQLKDWIHVQTQIERIKQVILDMKPPPYTDWIAHRVPASTDREEDWHGTEEPHE